MKSSGSSVVGFTVFEIDVFVKYTGSFTIGTYIFAKYRGSFTIGTCIFVKYRGSFTIVIDVFVSYRGSSTIGPYIFFRYRNSNAIYTTIVASPNTGNTVSLLEKHKEHCISTRQTQGILPLY